MKDFIKTGPVVCALLNHRHTKNKQTLPQLIQKIVRTITRYRMVEHCQNKFEPINMNETNFNSSNTNNNSSNYIIRADD